MKTFGLLGAHLSHSFSKKFFDNFFQKNKLPYHYQLFEFFNLKMFFEEMHNISGLSGFNVTIPFKEKIIPFLDRLSPEAQSVGAVNCVKIISGMLIGYNTDIFGFEKTLELVNTKKKQAVILGTGGAAKAVAYVLKQKNIAFNFVSEHPEKIPDCFSYETLWYENMKNYQIIINATPLGMYPKTSDFPKIPYHRLTPQHTLIDLVYNPIKTEFLFRGEQQGASIINGLVMLESQALKSWEIWNK
ncbi:MAG TPA: shikimate dehydrogenase [Bacteroidales bacterium]|nr:shikimate dehydrogenase [Bacteroidales bacterium]